MSRGNVGKVGNVYRLKADTRSLLPKLPHYINALFGGKMTTEEEHTYDNNGKIIDTQYRCLNVINNQGKNPLVKPSIEAVLSGKEYSIE